MTVSKDDAVEFARILQVVRASREREREGLPELARDELGLEFTESELAGVLETLEAESDELGEDQLEQAAGGTGGNTGGFDDIGGLEPEVSTMAVGEEGGYEVPL